MGLVVMGKPERGCQTWSSNNITFVFEVLFVIRSINLNLFDMGKSGRVYLM